MQAILNGVDDFRPRGRNSEPGRTDWCDTGSRGNYRKRPRVKYLQPTHSGLYLDGLDRDVRNLSTDLLLRLDVPRGEDEAPVPVVGEEVELGLLAVPSLERLLAAPRRFDQPEDIGCVHPSCSRRRTCVGVCVRASACYVSTFPCYHQPTPARRRNQLLWGRKGQGDQRIGDNHRRSTILVTNSWRTNSGRVSVSPPVQNQSYVTRRLDHLTCYFAAVRLARRAHFILRMYQRRKFRHKACRGKTSTKSSFA